MTPHLEPRDWVVLGLAAVGIGAALTAFLKTPPERRYKFPKAPPREEGVEYAEEYTPAGRRKFAIKTFAVAIPAFLLLQFWAFPQLDHFAKTSECQQYFGHSGAELLFYGIFVGLPLLCAALVGVPVALSGIRILREGRSPPKGVKVLQRTRVRRGAAAMWIGLSRQIALVMLVGLAIWGGSAAGSILAGSDHSGATSPKCTSSASPQSAPVPPDARRG